MVVPDIGHHLGQRDLLLSEGHSWERHQPGGGSRGWCRGWCRGWGPTLEGRAWVG